MKMWISGRARAIYIYIYVKKNIYIHLFIFEQNHKISFFLFLQNLGINTYPRVSHACMSNVHFLLF